MRVPSSAQASLLTLVADYESRGELVEWDTNEAEDGHRPSAARLYVERVDREKNTAKFDMACGWTYAHRVATVKACIKYGWLDDLHKRRLHSPKTQWTREHVYELVQLDTTEDGVIALGLWRERKLNAPAPPTPTLSGCAYEAVALADAAVRLGYRLVPHSDEARLQARRLKRDGWVHRGHVGASALSVVPTASGVVEVNPEAADVA